MHIAARIWCDPEYSHIVMNSTLAEHIAELLHREASRQETFDARGFMKAKAKEV